MTPPAANNCPQCGRRMPAGGISGLCPACVARLSFGFGPSVEPSGSQLDLDAPLLGEASSPVARHTIFGDYELLEEIGRGGMGIVFRARQVSLKRLVAVKVIPFGPLATEESVRRFRAEAEAAGHLQHPNIVAIHEIGEVEGQHFFSMDYVEGGTLADALRDGPLPARRAAEYLRTIAEAVQYAHTRGILHRDLKPSNILLDPKGEPRITDFGLARKLTEDSTLTLTGQVLGSPNYMPPEQASTTRTAPSPCSDIYSLGAVFYHALTGRPPFQGESVESVLGQLANNEPVSPRLLNPAVPRDLETICLKCLSKEPARRYDSAAELANELGRFLSDEPILAKPASRAEKVWRWCRRKPALATLLLVALLAAGAGLGMFLQWQRAQAAGAITRQFNYSSEMETAFRAYNNGDRGYARQLLEKHLPGTGAVGPDLRGWEWRYLWLKCRDEQSVTLGTHPAAVVALGFSPDGKLLASGDVRGGLRIWEIANRRAIFSTNLPQGRINALAFSPNGETLAHTTARGQVWLWQVSHWNQQGTLRQPGVAQLAFSANGRILSTANGSDVLLWDLEFLHESMQLRSVQNMRQLSLVAFAPDGETLAVADASGWVARWNYRTNSWMAPRWLAHSNAMGWPDTITAMSFGSVTPLLATAGGDRTVRIDRFNPRQIFILSNHTEAVTSVAFSPDDTKLLTGSMDQTVRLWDLASKQQLSNWHVHPGGCSQVRFAPDGRGFASAGSDGAVKLWNFTPKSDDSIVMPLPPKLRDALLFANPPVLATMTRDSHWQLWSLSGFQELQSGESPYPGNVRFYASIKGVGNGRILESDYRSIQFRRVTDGVVEPFVPCEQTDEITLALSPDGRLLTASAVDWLCVWDVPSKKQLRRWLTPGEGVDRLVRVCPDKRVVVTLEQDDGTLDFLDIATGGRTALSSRIIGSSVMAFSSNGQWLAAGGVGASIRIYDVPARKEFGSLEGSGFVTALAFSPDGRRLAAGTSRGVIQLWDLRTRRPVGSLPGHKTMVASVVFIDDETLASTTLSEARVWRAARTSETSKAGQ